MRAHCANAAGPAPFLTDNARLERRPRAAWLLGLAHGALQAIGSACLWAAAEWTVRLGTAHVADFFADFGLLAMVRAHALGSMRPSPYATCELAQVKSIIGLAVVAVTTLGWVGIAPLALARRAPAAAAAAAAGAAAAVASCGYDVDTGAPERARQTLASRQAHAQRHTHAPTTVERMRRAPNQPVAAGRGADRQLADMHTGAALPATPARAQRRELPRNELFGFRRLFVRPIQQKITSVLTDGRSPRPSYDSSDDDDSARSETSIAHERFRTSRKASGFVVPEITRKTVQAHTELMTQMAMNAKNGEIERLSKKLTDVLDGCRDIVGALHSEASGSPTLGEPARAGADAMPQGDGEVGPHTLTLARRQLQELLDAHEDAGGRRTSGVARSLYSPSVESAAAAGLGAQCVAPALGNSPVPAPRAGGKPPRRRPPGVGLADGADHTDGTTPSPMCARCCRTASASTAHSILDMSDGYARDSESDVRQLASGIRGAHSSPMKVRHPAAGSADAHALHSACHARQADLHAPTPRRAAARVAGDAEVTWTGAMGVRDVHRKLYDE